MTKIIHFSDSHQSFPKLPKGDILVFSGDFSFLPKNSPLDVMEQELHEFNRYLTSIKDRYKQIVVIPGNHDFIFEKHEKKAREILDAATVLINEEVIIDGIKFWGSPYTPKFRSWAFNSTRDELVEIWNKIPTDVDVLITHCPPKFILDVVEGNPNHLGCDVLYGLFDTKQISPKLHCSGHLHSARGIIKTKTTIFSNASIMDERYDPSYDCNVIDID